MNGEKPNAIRYLSRKIGRARTSADGSGWLGTKDENEVIGAAYRTRTCDPLITNEVLYQLS